jgi:hypothetical protein
MSKRPNLRDIPVLTDDVLVGMVNLCATELDAGDGDVSERRYAKNFINRAIGHALERTGKAERDYGELSDLLRMVRNFVPVFSCGDEMIDELVGWLEEQQISDYGFVSHRGLSYFFFKSWDDCILAKLKWG